MTERPLIIAITATNAVMENMIKAVENQTGDGNPFFCPKVEEGKPFNGHAHTFPPTGATSASSEPIKLK